MAWNYFIYYVRNHLYSFVLYVYILPLFSAQINTRLIFQKIKMIQSKDAVYVFTFMMKRVTIYKFIFRLHNLYDIPRINIPHILYMLRWWLCLANQFISTNFFLQKLNSYICGATQKLIQFKYIYIFFYSQVNVIHFKLILLYSIWHFCLHFLWIILFVLRSNFIFNILSYYR